MKQVLRTTRSQILGLLFKIFVSRLSLDASVLSGKKVLVVGPANGVSGELKELTGESFDFVIRMNNGISTASNSVFPKTDILFHNFKEGGPRSAGRFVRSVLRRSGVRFLLFTHPTKSRALTLLRARLRVYRLGCSSLLRIPPPEWYSDLSQSFGVWEPTTGSVAIAFALEGGPCRLVVVGFTFFSTRYESGYNDSVSDEDALAWARNLGSHNPDVDRERMRDLFKMANSSGVDLLLGKATADSVRLDRFGGALT